MARKQSDADKAASRSLTRTPPDDSRTSYDLHRTNERERAHRDRGTASDSDAWRQHQREGRD